MRGIDFGMGVSKMTNEEFLQRYDSGKPNFTEDEIKDMAYGYIGYYVDTIEGANRRWVQGVKTIFEIDDRLFAVSWDRGLTERQENEFYCSEVYEVVKKIEYVKKIDYVKKE